MSANSTATWTAVIPVKAWAKAKSRLQGSEEARTEFARAVTLDTLETVATSVMVGRIVVVTSEPALAKVTTTIRTAVMLDEPPGESPDQLNDAIRLARDWAVDHAPASPIVVIPADLPALTPVSLEAALHQLAWFDRTHIPDHRGNGTTLSAAARPDLLDPHYGLASERAHAATQSIPIVQVDAGVRLDVDSLEDLAGAKVLGLGRRTLNVSYCK